MNKKALILALAATLAVSACKDKDDKKAEAVEQSPQTTEVQKAEQAPAPQVEQSAPQAEVKPQAPQVEEKQPETKQPEATTPVEAPKAAETVKVDETVTAEKAELQNAIAEVNSEQEVKDFLNLSAAQAMHEQQLQALQAEILKAPSATAQEQDVILGKVSKVIGEVKQSLQSVDVKTPTVKAIRDKAVEVVDRTQELFVMAVQLEGTDPKVAEAKATEVQNKVTTLQTVTLELQTLEQQFISSHQEALKQATQQVQPATVEPQPAQTGETK